MNQGRTGNIIAEIVEQTTTVVSTPTEIFSADVRGAKRMVVQLDNQATGSGGIILNLCTTYALLGKDSTSGITVATSGADYIGDTYKEPKGFVVAASTDIAVLDQAVTGWVIFDVEGLATLSMDASVASGNTVITYTYTLYK